MAECKKYFWILPEHGMSAAVQSYPGWSRKVLEGVFLFVFQT